MKRKVTSLIDVCFKVPNAEAKASPDQLVASQDSPVLSIMLIFTIVIQLIRYILSVCYREKDALLIPFVGCSDRHFMKPRLLLFKNGHRTLKLG